MLALAAGLLIQARSRAGGQDLVWKPILTDADALKVIDQSKAIIHEELNKPRDTKVKARKSNKRIQVEAALIAAYALSAKAGPSKPQLMSMALAALELNKAAGVANADFNRIKQLAQNLGDARGNGRAGLGKVDWTKYFDDQGDVMLPFKTLEKGGNGLAKALQVNPKVRGRMNGIEEKIRNLANTRPPTMQRNIKKEAAELALLADKIAVIAQVNYEFAPKEKEGKKDPADWKQWSIDMQNAALALAAAARKSNPAMVLAAAQKLNSSCVRCHNIFKETD
jgi:hypothetical protein